MGIGVVSPRNFVGSPAPRVEKCKVTLGTNLKNLLLSTQALDFDASKLVWHPEAAPNQCTKSQIQPTWGCLWTRKHTVTSSTKRSGNVLQLGGTTLAACLLSPGLMLKLKSA